MDHACIQVLIISCRPKIIVFELSLIAFCCFTEFYGIRHTQLGVKYFFFFFFFFFFNFGLDRFDSK